MSYIAKINPLTGMVELVERPPMPRISGSGGMGGGGGSGGGTWGSITGAIPDQTDLQSALDSKAGLVHTHTATEVTDFDDEVSNNTDVAANTTARHSAVTLAGTPDYISLSGQQITRNQIDLTTDVTGVLPNANVADDITLTNLTQITNRDHGSTTGLTDDDHTQYALLAGRSTTQTLSGSTVDGQTLQLRSNTADTHGDAINLLSSLEFYPSDQTFTTAPLTPIVLNNSYTYDVAGQIIKTLENAATYVLPQGTNAFNSGILFSSALTLKTENGTPATVGPFIAFSGSPTYTGDGAAMSLAAAYTFREFSTFSTTNGGSLAIASSTNFWAQFLAGAGSVGSGVSIVNRVAFRVENPSVSGTLNVNRGVNLADLTSGRDFNYAWLGGSGLMKHGDDIEVDSSTGVKGLILHSPDDTRWRITVSNAGAISAAEITFDPVVDMDWYAWFRADQAYVGSPADLGDVTVWQDKSGNGRDLAIGTGTDVPTWENSLAAINNQPAVEFTAANSQSLEQTSGISITAATTYSICAVVTFKTVAAVMRIFGHNSSATNRGFGITATPNWSTQMGATAASAGTPATGTRYFVRIFATASAHTLYVNEVSTATTATAANAVSQIVLGAGRAAAPSYGNYFNGYIAEVGVFTGDVSTATRWADYKAYLNSRYSFTL